MPPGSGQPIDPNELLNDLTPAQREAVMHVEGPLLVLAGAGSGKTRVITRRVAYLLTQGIKPWNILAITFTNKAAGEMRQRVESLVSNSRVWISTFHSLGARLLRMYADRVNIGKNFTIYDQDDRVRIVKEALEAANIDNARFTPERISGAISMAKNQLLLPEAYAARASDFFAITVAKVYFHYQKRLRANDAVDFDDLLMIPALALKTDEELRSELDMRFRYVLIDEYQDTNAAQYEMARRLSINFPNICVVGDPDQSIYKWRGSDIRNILDFERDFPNARTITLDLNYRSVPAILAAASSLIAHNKHRKPKDLVATRPAGHPVRVLMFDTGLDEAEQIAKRIKDACANGARSYRDFAIFLRINALSRALEAAFIKNGMPYQVVKGLAFFERKENKDVLAYLRLLANPNDNLSFLRVVNEPARGIGPTTLKHLTNYANDREISLMAACGAIDRIPAIKNKAATGLKEFHALLSTLRECLDASPDEVIRQVIDRSGYRRMLAGSNDQDDLDRLANIEELITAAKEFAEEDPTRTIGDFLEQITLASDVDGWNDQQECVSIMTLHSSKGLEFPVVYMLAVEQGLLPHDRSLANDEEVEEERRLCFVGMTRAKEELYMSHARLREFRGQALYAVSSMFLDELPVDSIERVDLSHRWDGMNAPQVSRFQMAADEDMPPSEYEQNGDSPEYSSGLLIDHAMYGRGKIVDVEGIGIRRRLRIHFAEHGVKVFIASKVKLTVVIED